MVIRSVARSSLAYARIVASKWIVSLPGVVLTVLGVVNEARGEKDQLVLAPEWCLVLALLCIIVAQFLAWRDFWLQPVAPDHAASLRDAASRYLEAALEERAFSSSDFDLQAFRAHFPEAETCSAELRAATAALRGAKQALLQQVRNDLSTYFPEAGDRRAELIKHLWNWWNRCLVLGDPDQASFAVESTGDRRGVYWDGVTLILDPDGPPRDSWTVEVAGWAIDSWDLPESIAARDAQAAIVAATARLDGFLDPIVRGQTIQRAEECPACRPK